MTNGVAYVVDDEGSFEIRTNSESVLIERFEDAEDAAEFRALIERHVEMTGSLRGKHLLANWESTLATTWKVIPRARLALERELQESMQTQGAAD